MDNAQHCDNLRSENQHDLRKTSKNTHAQMQRSTTVHVKNEVALAKAICSPNREHPVISHV